LHSYSLLYFIILPGFPTTTAKSGISEIMTAPAPTVTHLPIFRFGITTAPAPIWVPSPIETLPVIVTLGDM
jgi:hypothetical protein